MNLSFLSLQWSKVLSCQIVRTNHVVSSGAEQTCGEGKPEWLSSLWDPCCFCP